MISYDLARARAAVQYLVESSYFHQHVLKLRSAAARPRTLPFKGEAEALNELLVIGRQNLQALENLIKVAEYKRDDRNEYQRQYMAAKRKRDRKVVEFEERVTGKKLPAEARIQVLMRQYRIWNTERETLMASISKLPWAERNAKIKAFWDTKEREIDALIEEAKASGPVSRKRVVRVASKPTTEFGRQLAAKLGR